MGHPSVRGDAPVTLRAVRADGTPVYGYAERPGRPPVSVALMDARSPVAQSSGRRHAHDFHALVYVERGAGSVMVDGREVPLRDGELHAVNPGRPVAVGGAHQHAGTRTWTVAFTPDAVPALASVSPLAWDTHPLLALFVADAGSVRVPEADRPVWAGWLTDLDGEVRQPDRIGAYDAATALLTRLLVASARLAPPSRIQAGTLDPLVARVFAEIESGYASGATATDIAVALGYTPGHLTTVLRRRTGRTLLDWLTERRLTEVRRLLRETDLPLGVIASRTGLGDASYLVRRFRRRYGVTPDRWRRGRATERSSVSSSG